MSHTEIQNRRGNIVAVKVKYPKKIRNRISGYPNSGRHNPAPVDHPYQILASWDVNCGHD